MPNASASKKKFKPDTSAIAIIAPNEKPRTCKKPPWRTSNRASSPKSSARKPNSPKSKPNSGRRNRSEIEPKPPSESSASPPNSLNGDSKNSKKVSSNDGNNSKPCASNSTNAKRICPIPYRKSPRKLISTPCKKNLNPWPSASRRWNR